MSYLGIFGLEFWKTIVIFEISTFEFFKLQNFAKKQKCINLGPKMPFLGIFDQKCLICLFLGKNFQKAIVKFEIRILNLSKCKIWRKSKNTYIWDHKSLIWVFLTKNALLLCFWARILIKYCHI